MSLSETIAALGKLSPTATVYIMAQNPGDNFHWSKPVGPAIQAIDLFQALAARTESPASTGGVEAGWLIEAWDSRRNVFHAKWWELAQTEESCGDWTKDSTKALRFARECDAQAYIDDIGWTEAKPTEHRWLAASPQDQESGR